MREQGIPEAPFAKVGFLSTAMIPGIRAVWAPLFDIAEELSQCGQAQMECFPGIKFELAHTLVVPLFLRGLSNFQSTILLNERGLIQEAKTIARGIFEAVFYLSAARIDPEGSIDAAIGDDIVRREKLARAVLKMNADPISPGLDASLTAFLDHASQQPRAKGLTVEAAARKGGLIELYDTYYRDLSNSSAHPSLSALERYLGDSNEPGVVEYIWEPAAQHELRTSIVISIIGAFSLLAEAAECFGIEPIKERIADCWQRYQNACDSQKKG